MFACATSLRMRAIVLSGTPAYSEPLSPMMGSTNTRTPLAAWRSQNSAMMWASSSVTMKPVDTASKVKPNSSQMGSVFFT